MRRRNRSSVVLVLMFLGALVALPAWGQPPKGPPAKKPGGPPLVKDDLFLKLLAVEPVQAELEILDEQRSKFREIGESLAAKVKEIVGDVDPRGLNPEEQRALREKLKAKEAEWQGWLRDEIAGVLLPHQLKRLQQIALQLRGIDALNDPEVAKQLNMTPAQLDSIARLREEAKQEREKIKREVDALVRGKEAGELRKEQEEKLRQDFDKRVRGTLTPVQARKWNEMLGETFDTSRLKGGEGPKPAKPPKSPKEPVEAPQP